MDDARKPDRRAELTQAPPEPIRVGAGTAFYLGGTLELDPSVGRVMLRVAGVETEVDAHSMPPERAYGAGGLWWSLVEIAGPVPPGRVEVEVRTDTGRDQPDLRAEIVLAAGMEGLPEEAPAPASAGADPLIAICMATYEPHPDRLARQLDSIRAQTWGNWICVISDDSSSPDAFAEVERQVAGDPRFFVSRSDERLGFLRNFERAIALAPADAEMIALGDQDDRWDADKLVALAAALRANPASLLATATSGSPTPTATSSRTRSSSSAATTPRAWRR